MCLPPDPPEQTSLGDLLRVSTVVYVLSQRLIHILVLFQPVLELLLQAQELHIPAQEGRDDSR